MPVTPAFLNVDLDLRAPRDLTPLAAALGGRVVVLRCGPEGGDHVLSVELLEARRSIDTTLAGLCALVEGLPPQARALWESCPVRDFSAGFESACVADARAGGQFYGAIATETLARIARLGGTLSVTVYPALCRTRRRGRVWRR